MTQWVRCAHGQCSYPCQSCTPAYQERVENDDEEETETVQSPLKTGVENSAMKVHIFTRNKARVFEFIFEFYPTVSDIKQNIQENLQIQCDDVLLYDFDGERYFECLDGTKPLEILQLNNTKLIEPVIRFILVIRGNVTSDVVKEFCFETVDELEIPVLGFPTRINIETMRSFIKSAIASKFKIPMENYFTVWVP